MDDATTLSANCKLGARFRVAAPSTREVYTNERVAVMKCVA